MIARTVTMNSGATDRAHGGELFYIEATGGLLVTGFTPVGLTFQFDLDGTDIPILAGRRVNKHFKSVLIKHPPALGSFTILAFEENEHVSDMPQPLATTTVNGARSSTIRVISQLSRPASVGGNQSQFFLANKLANKLAYRIVGGAWRLTTLGAKSPKEFGLYYGDLADANDAGAIIYQRFPPFSAPALQAFTRDTLVAAIIAPNVSIDYLDGATSTPIAGSVLDGLLILPGTAFIWTPPVGSGAVSLDVVLEEWADPA